MTIAREAAKGKLKKVEPKLIDVTGMKVYPPPDKSGRKHYNFNPRSSENSKGGLYADD
jgi:hypothetical protein